MGIRAIGVRLADLRLDPKEAIQVAARIGFQCIETEGSTGPLRAEELTSTGRRHLWRYVADAGMTIDAVALNAASEPLGPAADLDRLVAQGERVLGLAADLRAPLALLRVDPGTADGGRPEDSAVRTAVGALIDRADRRGLRLVLDAPQVPPASLVAMASRMAAGTVGHCLDTGTCLTYGSDPAEVITSGAGAMWLVHGRDGTRGNVEAPGQEVADGAGRLDVEAAIAALEAADYAGPIVLTRSGSSAAMRELAAAFQRWTRFV